MSGGAGHIYDMIKRLEANAILLKKPGYFKIKQELLKVTGKTIYEFKSATPEQLAAIRSKLIRQRKKQFIKTIILLVLSTIGAIAIISFLIYWFRT